MRLKRLTVWLAAFVLMALGPANLAHAKKFALTGGGGQLHIGNGLMLPIQTAGQPATNTGNKFPNLLVPVAANPGTPILTGTVAKSIMTAGTRMAYQRRLNIPAGVLHKDPTLTTVGVFFSNPTVYAVATYVEYDWPTAPVVLTTATAVHPSLATNVVTGFGGSITYSNPLGRFGGPGQFRLSPGAEPPLQGLKPIGVTVYAKVLPGQINPPCTHNAFGGTQPGCNALLLAGAAMTADLGQGKTTGVTEDIPGAAVTQPNVAVLKLGGTSLSFMWGTVISAAAVAPGPALVNDANSQGGPWTTGTIVVKNGAAVPMNETFTLRGRDQRTANGGGTIQLVSGAVSTRTLTMANANRGWVRLNLTPVDPVPATPWWGIAVIGALVLLGFGYATRRRIFA